jgi:hypothetical protein
MKTCLRKITTTIAGLLPLLLPSAAYANGCVETTLGCIPSDPHDLVFTWLLPNALKLAALAAVALLIIGGYQFVGATGDMDKLAAAKSTITAAIAGFLFILCSVVILRIMGIDILGIEEWIF